MPPRRHHKLRRLDRIWIRDPIYFVTTCTHRRGCLLNSPAAHEICREVWETGCRLHGWDVGRYVIMPDHVHFFCAPGLGSKDLFTFVGKWKEWTAKFLRDRCSIAMPLWQERFFDRVLRSKEAYAQKYDYVVENPVRARLTATSQEWPFQGSMGDIGAGDVERL